MNINALTEGPAKSYTGIRDKGVSGGGSLRLNTLNIKKNTP